MNYKRCALRNDLKTKTIRTMSKGLDIELISNLLDSEMEGIGFLDDVTSRLEKQVESEYGGKLNYDATSMEKLYSIVRSTVDESVIKSTVSTTLTEYLCKENADLKTGASMKWVNVRGQAEAEFNICNIVELQDDMDDIILEAFIYSIIEESEPKVAVYKAFTKGCKQKGIGKERYMHWYEETE